MIGKAIAALVGVGIVVVVVQAGEDKLATVEYTACQNIPVNHYVSLGDNTSLYVPPNGTPLTRGRVYELTYVVGDGKITVSRDVRQATCSG